jgi:hypothetical protein
MQCRIRKHDALQFEVKIAYPLRREARRGRHDLDLFLFLPYQLGVDPATYPAASFYEELRTYTRFKTPDIPLRSLLDPGEKASPLTRVAEMLRAGREAGRWDAARLVYEIKVLANVARARARDRVRAVRRAMRREDWEKARGDLERLAADLGELLARLDKLPGELSAANAPPEAARAARLVQEYVGVQTEGMLLRLLRRMGREETSEAHRAMRERVLSFLRERPRAEPEVDVSRDARANEYFLYREGLLKKFCAEVLFLSVERRSGVRPAQHVVFGLAAGLAMAVAVTAAALVGRAFPRSSMAFATAAVVAYVLKDRIKELVRDYGARLLPRWLGDRKGRLTDPQRGDRIGKTSESVRWRAPKEVPEEVSQARRRDGAAERDVFSPPELVIQYSKRIELDHGAIYRRHQRAAAIDDIIRLQVGRWLAHMDNPRKRLLRLDESGEIEALRAPRVYHVNLVARMTAPDGGPAQLSRARLVLSKNGIERIEHFSLENSDPQ